MQYTSLTDMFHSDSHIAEDIKSLIRLDQCQIKSN